MNKYPDFYSVVIGAGPLGIFLGFLFVSFFAALISVLQNIATRRKDDTAALKPWSTKYMIIDNLIRFLANILVIPLLIRVTYEVVDLKWEIALSIVFGIMVDRLALWLKDIGVFAMDKFTDKIKTQITDKLNSK